MGGMPLDWAAARNDIAMVELLLANRAYISAKDGLGETPLFWAIKASKEMVEVLLANGADVNAKDKDGWTPLHWAVTDDRLPKPGRLLIW